MNELVAEGGGYAVELWLADDGLATVQPELEAVLAVARVPVLAEVHGGVAFLRGTVASYADKLAAGDAVMSVPGIWRIADDLVVEPCDIGDAALRHRIHLALAWDSRLTSCPSVAVEDGRVTLGGTVATDAEREAVLDVVARFRGVRDIINGIAVPPLPRPPHVVDRVEQAIEHALGRDARHVHVSTADGSVELKGWVRTLAQRMAAERAVRGVMGDTPLDNALRVKH